MNFTTLYQYDSYGNVKKVSNPRALVSNYTYNYLNQLYQKVTPDAGTELYGYNPDGTLAAMQDANGVIRVYTYDQFGRMLSQKKVTNAATATFLFTNNGNPWITGLTTYQTNFASLLSSNSTFEKKWFYDTYDATLNNNYLANAKPYLLYSISNAKGRLVQTIAYNNTGVGVEYRWFSYNTDGFLKWEMSQFHFQAIAAASGLRGRLFRIDYPSYNRQGSPLLAKVDFNGDHSLDGQYAYNYDGLNRLKSVWFNYDNSQNNTGGGVNGGSKILEYDYDDLKNKVTKKRYYANFKYTGVCNDNTNKLIDEYTYTYDQRFRLTDLSSTTNYFRWQLYYDGNNASTANAYGVSPSTSTNWNGNINSTMATYNVAGIGGTGMSGPTTYHYTYDAINRLTKGDAGVNIQTYSPGFANQPDLGDEAMTYDRIGNISTLNRGELISGTLAQNLYAYTYLSTNNRLQSVNKNGAADRSVGYDSNGNMLTDSKIGITASTLGRANLPYAVTKSGTSISYLYSGDDNRIYKAVSTTQKEWYIRTGGGADLGVFDISNNKYTWYVFGAERVAKINHVPTLTITEAAGNTGGNLYASDPFVIPLNVGSNLPAPIADYYAYDHLGNTRLVYGALIGCASSVPNYQLRYAGDYYPFGKVVREYSATTSEKYLYTQKERDKETGLDYFGARYYDSELGRFLGVDPLAGLYPSLTAYSYVANNPLINRDPTGAYIEPASQQEWDKQTKSVTKQRDKLQSDIDKLSTKAADNGWSAEKLARKIGNKQERVNSLNSSISTFQTLEGSTQGYSLKTGAGEVGGTYYDKATGNVVIDFSSTANFVHETTHAGQFESGDLAFDPNSHQSYAQDLFDEVSAYKAELAYSGGSVGGALESASSFSAITPDFVKRIATTTGVLPYANHGIIPVNINSGVADLLKAYPHAAAVLNGLPSSLVLKDLTQLIYKK